MKSIILCADDYGQNRAISQAILALLEKNRLSAVSCMTNSPDWPQQAGFLKAFSDRIDIGLHFNLTEGESLSRAFALESLPRVLIKSSLRQLNQAAIEKELVAQLNQFKEVMGCLPQFIDGHQHIHYFPIVRDALFSVYETHLRPSKAYLRSVADPHPFSFPRSVKKCVMQGWLGATSFKKALIQRDIPHNTSFSGVYNFSDRYAYADLFSHFLKSVETGGLIMCHPGKKGETKDAISAARQREYAYLMSDTFLTACQEHHVKITRFYDE
jgi:predicted glycoside hydrolase/deacetylase ChbG (UPF0249 family)